MNNYLQKKILLETSDKRSLLGMFRGFDEEGNVALEDCSEIKHGHFLFGYPIEDSTYLGKVFVEWEKVRSVMANGEPTLLVQGSCSHTTAGLHTLK